MQRHALETTQLNLSLLQRMLRQWAEVAKAIRLDNQLKRARRVAFRRWQEQIADSVLTSFRRGDMSECWRKSRLLAGRRLVPKQRRYGICPETSPTQDEWERYLAGPGYNGGCLA
eukprot:11588638-Heterocapsa_arctica.AAC.1